MADGSAGEVLAASALAALAGLSGLNGVYDGMPLKASVPFAVIELGPESDWSWKGGAGREVRLTATVRDAGEQATRLRALMAKVETALLGLNECGGGWRIINVVTMRVRTAQRRAGEWSGAVELRARMEREE